MIVAPRSLLLPLGVAAAAVAMVLATGPGSADEGGRPADQADPDDGEQVDAELVDAGEALYRRSCVTCHGVDGNGQTTPGGQLRGPSLVESGAAGAYYQLTTGRMPLASPGDIPTRKPPVFDADEIDALVAYVASLGSGPTVPDVDVAAGELAEGGELYRANCQACHSATGSGGALSYGRAAPPLAAATPTEIGAAVRSGPGPMPRFGREIISDDELDSVARYVEYLDDPDDRGGLALGRLGPIPEGFMTWVGALGALLILCTWLGRRWLTLPEVDPTPAVEVPLRPDDSGGQTPAVADEDDTP